MPCAGILPGFQACGRERPVCAGSPGRGVDEGLGGTKARQAWSVTRHGILLANPSSTRAFVEKTGSNAAQYEGSLAAAGLRPPPAFQLCGCSDGERVMTALA